MSRINPALVDVGDVVVVGGTDFAVKKTVEGYIGINFRVVIIHLLPMTNLEGSAYITITWPEHIPIEIKD